MGRIERRLRLHDMRILIAVVQSGTMRKAAERLATSQPAVSRAIADLEHALGVRLLDRNPRGVEPTLYGRAIIKRGIAVFDELRQGVKEIEFLADPTAGELRIGCTEAMAAGPVLVAIDRLTRRHPRMMFRVVTGAVPTVCRELADRNVELVVGRITKGAIDEERMIVDTLFEESLVVVAGTPSPWARRRKIELAELAKEPWILAPFDNNSSVSIMEAFRARGLKPPRVTLIAESLNMRNRLLASGRFLAVLPRRALTFAGRDPSLKALPVDLLLPPWKVGIVTLMNRTLSPLADLFIKTAHAVAKPLAD